MAIFDLAQKAIILKIVYYGCAMGGKTTNLLTLHRLTDPEGQQGMVSIATKNDRTLFFDLLPLELGQLGGLSVRIKMYTVPGQVHYETTRRQVLSGADGAVLVADSEPKMAQANHWALDNLRQNLKRNGLDPKTFPIVLQWNKRDLPGALSVAELETALNRDRLPSREAIATTGVGVLETFSLVVKAAILAAHDKAGKKSVAEEELDRMLSKALGKAGSAVGASSEAADTPVFDRRFDEEQYRDDWADRGRDRQIVDEKTLLSEAVQTGMELAEKLDDLNEVRRGNERLERMLIRAGALASGLVDPQGPALPKSMMAGLLADAGRSRGSMLVFKANEKIMEEREVVPAGPDPLNHADQSSLGSVAFRLCQGEEPRLVEDLVGEVFFTCVPPEADGLASALIVPVCCEGVRFGALVVYFPIDEPTVGDAERSYWQSAAKFIGLSLHWRGLRQRLIRQTPGSTGREGRC